MVLYRDPYACGTTDQDGDGIIDAVDPKPTTSGAFTYKIWAKQRDANGNVVCIFIEDSDGSRTSYFGTYSTTLPIEITGDPTIYTSAGLADQMASVGAYSGQLDPVTAVINTPTQQPNQSTTTGTADTGNTTDLDRQIDIVTNTKATADNVGKNVLATEQVRDSVNNLAKILAEKNPGGGGGSTGTTPATVEEGVGDALEDAEARADATLGDADWGTNGEYTGFTESDIPQKPKTLTQVLVASLVSHPLSAYMNQIGVELTGQTCSFPFTVYGRTVTFSLCNYASILDVMGLIVLGLASFYSIMIVMGRG